MKRIFGVAFISVLVDQLIKQLVIRHYEFAHSVDIIPNFFRITYLKNTGAAFSVLMGNQLFLIFVTLGFLLLIYFFFIKGQKLNKLEMYLYGFLIGGALSNLIDRIHYNYVIDYLDFNIGDYNYPVFNFADICIVISIIGLIVLNVRGNSNGN